MGIMNPGNGFLTRARADSRSRGNNRFVARISTNAVASLIAASQASVSCELSSSGSSGNAGHPGIPSPALSNFNVPIALSRAVVALEMSASFAFSMATQAHIGEASGPRVVPWLRA